MKKRFLAIVLALCLALALLPTAAFAADGSTGSGSASLPKLSKQEIADLLNAAPTDMPHDIFVSAPSCSAPYAAGQVRQEVLDMAAARLSALRRLAGLPAVTADPTLCAQAQYGAVISGKLGVTVHTPSKPVDMDDDFYQKAYQATSSSNLYPGLLLLDTPDNFMNDSDGSNVDRVGHRRWQLNPTMGKVGFGYVDSGNGYQRFTAEKVFDESGSCSDYDYIAWPASGYFPNDLDGFGRNTAWSVSVNPDRYQQPTLSSVNVTLTRQSDGKTWSFSGQNSYIPASSGLYFNINTTNYGINNCIIFRPDGIDKYEGVYEVEITGLRNRNGSAAELHYQVDFFDSRFAGSDQPTLPTVENIPAAGTAVAQTQNVLLDGRTVQFQYYAVKDANGNMTNYVKLRDLAQALSGTRAQFNVDWNGKISIISNTAYQSVGGEGSTPYSGDQPYKAVSNDPVSFNGSDVNLTSFRITYQGSGYTYYKLRDLGQLLNFNVTWNGSSIVVESDKPYTG